MREAVEVYVDLMKEDVTVYQVMDSIVMAATDPGLTSREIRYLKVKAGMRVKDIMEKEISDRVKYQAILREIERSLPKEEE